MPKSTFIPNSDHDFLAWLDHFVPSLTPDYGLSESDLNALKAATTDLHVKSAYANDASTISKRATSDKNDSRRILETLVRAEVRRIKARSDYTEGQGAHLGIEGPEKTYNLSTANPDLSGIDQTGGQVSLSFTKHNSAGINIYCQRENDIDWTLLGRATVSPFLDNRPLLQTGKPELRRYTAVYMSKDNETGKYSDDLVINCAP